VEPRAEKETKAVLRAKASNLLATGGLLTRAALVTLVAVAPVFRRREPPRWATYGSADESHPLAIICTLALGGGGLASGTIDAWRRGLDYVDLGLLATVSSVAVVIWRRLSAHAGPRALEADARMPLTPSEPPPQDRTA
jgi:hypothetical protein